MKKIALLLFGLVAFSSFAQQKTQATANQPAKPLAEKYTAQMGDMILLTFKQKTVIKSLYEEHFTKYPQTDANVQATPDERVAKAQEVKKENAEFDAKLKGVLTAEQFEKWQYIREHPLAAGLKAGAEKGK